MSEPSTPAPVVSDWREKIARGIARFRVQWNAANDVHRLESEPDEAFLARAVEHAWRDWLPEADALLSGPLAEMQAEHQAEVEGLVNALKAALPAVMVFDGPRSDERLHLVEAQLAQYQTASGEPKNVG